MFNDFKKEITIMKNFMNYICLFLMILGINISVNAATEISITPDPIVVNVEMEGEGVEGTLNFTYSITDAFAVYYNDTYGYYQVALDNDDDYEKILLDSHYDTFLSVSEEVNVDFVAYESGSYDGTITCYAYTDIYGSDFVEKEIKFTINVTAPQPQVVFTNYQTYCPRTVMFDLNGLSGEAPADIVTKKNQTITDPGDPVTPEGITFLGWYNGDTKWNFESDLVTEDMQLSAKCQSALVISGNVHLTSGNGVQVYTTPATNNMITVSWFGKDEPLATKIRFSYYLNGQKVTDDTQSPFRVCNADNYNMVSGNIDNAGENFEQTFAVSYKPTAYNQLDNYTIRVEAVNDAGKQVYRSADLAVYGRSLPEQFVMVIKKTTDDKGWYAIPNELASTSSASADDMPMPLLVEVNDNTNPTFVKPSENVSKALYSTAARNTISNHRGGIRLKSVANKKFMTATKTDKNSFYMPDGNSEDNQPFYLNSSNFGAYKVTLDPALYGNNTPDRWISMYAGKIAWYNTQACDVYFLPLKTITEEIEVNDGETINLSDYEVDETTTVIVHAGGIFNADKVATIGNLTIEVGQTKSGQIKGDAAITITGDAYMQLEVDPADAASQGWYAFAVPFPVDALNGVYYNDTKLTNEVGYAIMDYHGDVRAQGQYGWKKYRGILQPGVFYYLTVGDTDYKTLRFHLKKDGETYTLQNNYSVDYKAYPSENLQDAGYNGVANKTLENVKIEKTENMSATVYTYDNANKVFATTDLDVDDPTFLPAQPFFVTVNADGSFNLSAQPTPATAPRWMAENEVQTMSKVKVTLANESYTDNYYVSASSEAKTEYEQLKDAVKMGTIDNNTKVPQIASVNYNNTLLSAEYAQLVNGQATISLLLYAPADGEYTIAATECKDGTIYLTQNGIDIWNLKDAYTLTLNKGKAFEYGLRLVVDSGQAPTNINSLNGNNKAQKIFKDYNIYILRDAQMYNTQGVKVQ